MLPPVSRLDSRRISEGLGGEVLRLVDNQNRPNTIGVLLDEKIVKIPLQGHFVPAMDIQAEFFIDRRQQLVSTKGGIKDHGQHRITGQARHEILKDGGLARTDFAGEQDKPGPFLQTVL